MADPQTSRFWQAALQSELIDEAALRACLEAIPPEKRAPADQLERRLARQTIQSGYLTLWQAQQLLSGRSSGFRINRYVLLDLIGQGGMGRVYLAKDTRLNRRVAVKILSPERVNNPRAIARFQREARAGAQLQHENLVRIYDEGEANGKCYLVMEYIEGKNIGTMIADGGPIPPAIAARLTRQVALGLDHAHKKGLIHRDVNPYNILVTRDGTAKLTDLGLAIDLTDQVPVTRDGATVGTFDYVSPEQARHSHSVDTRSDIYSLGCTLYHMIAGQVPFSSPSLPEKLFGHQAVEPEPLTNLVPGVPEGLAQVVQRMMRKAPEERYATPLELAEALEPFAEVSEGSTSRFAVPVMRPDAGAPRPENAETRITQVSSERVTAPGGLPFPIAEPPPPTIADPIDLGIALGTAPTAPAPAPTKAEPAKKPAPAKPSPPAAKPAEATPPPQPAAPEDVDTVVLPGLAALTSSAPPASEGVNLGIALEPRPAPSPSPSPASPAPPRPEVPAPPTKPAPAPTASTPAADTLPADFAASLAGKKEKKPAAEPINLGLALNLEAAPPAPAEAKLSAPPSKPKPKLAPAPTPEPAPELPADFAASLAGKSPKPADGPINLGLGLDLGPGPAAAPAKPAPVLPAPAKPREDEKEPRAEAPPALPKRWILIGAGAAGLLVVVALLAVALNGFGTSGNAAVKKSGKTTAATNTTKPAVKPATDDEVIPEGSGFAVRTSTGEILTEPDLKGAMQRAIGSKGRVLLNNRTPLRLTGPEAAMRLTGGLLVIAAAKGTQPVLEVEIKERSPFLSTGTDTPLQLIGVTIRAHYAMEGKDAPPLIQAGARVTLERCAFSASGPVAGRRAVIAEGTSLSATGCWFEGFDQAIDFASFAGTSATMKDCMMIRARSAEGWAVRVRAMPGGSPGRQGRKVVMERCTVKGKGLLDLVDFKPEAPLSVDLRDCAIQGEAVLAWESSGGDALRSGALKWSGKDNQYDIHGKSWIVLDPEATTSLPDGPTDLASWSKKFTDHNATDAPVKFQTESSAPPESLVPQDFAVSSPGGSPIGADPDRVGPGAKAAK